MPVCSINASMPLSMWIEDMIVPWMASRHHCTVGGLKSGQVWHIVILAVWSAMSAVMWRTIDVTMPTFIESGRKILHTRADPCPDWRTLTSPCESWVSSSCAFISSSSSAAICSTAWNTCSCCLRNWMNSAVTLLITGFAKLRLESISVSAAYTLRSCRIAARKRMKEARPEDLLFAMAAKHAYMILYAFWGIIKVWTGLLLSEVLIANVSTWRHMEYIILDPLVCDKCINQGEDPYQNPIRTFHQPIFDLYSDHHQPSTLCWNW